MGENVGTRSALAQPRVDGVQYELAFEPVLAGAQDGAPWAFRRLFTALGPVVLGYFRGQGADDPDGSANEVFLRAFRDIGRFRGTEAQFRSWVFTVAHNVLIDERRKRARRPVTTDGFERAHSVSGGDAEADALVRLEAETLRPLLASLTDDQREVLLLRVAADLPAEDVARITGRTSAAVRALHHRALVSVRRSVGA